MKKQTNSTDNCSACVERKKCDISHGPDDGCINFNTHRRRNFLWAVILVVIFFTLLFLFGCTDRACYRHEWTDPNGIKHLSVLDYSEGVGNNVKQDFLIGLPDGAVLMFGVSTINQDAYMDVLRQYRISAEAMTAAWWLGIPLRAPSIGDGVPETVITTKK